MNWNSIKVLGIGMLLFAIPDFKYSVFIKYYEEYLKIPKF